MSAMAEKRARQAELRRLMQAEREQLQQEQTQTQAQATRQAAPLAGVLRKSKYGPLGQETGLSQLPSEEKEALPVCGVAGLLGGYGDSDSDSDSDSAQRGDGGGNEAQGEMTGGADFLSGDKGKSNRAAQALAVAPVRRGEGPSSSEADASGLAKDAAAVLLPYVDEEEAAAEGPASDDDLEREFQDLVGNGKDANTRSYGGCSSGSVGDVAAGEAQLSKPDASASAGATATDTSTVEQAAYEARLGRLLLLRAKRGARGTGRLIGSGENRKRVGGGDQSEGGIGIVQTKESIPSRAEVSAEQLEELRGASAGFSFEGDGDNRVGEETRHATKRPAAAAEAAAPLAILRRKKAKAREIADNETEAACWRRCTFGAGGFDEDENGGFL